MEATTIKRSVIMKIARLRFSRCVFNKLNNAEIFLFRDSWYLSFKRKEEKCYQIIKADPGIANTGLDFCEVNNDN